MPSEFRAPPALTETLLIAVPLWQARIELSGNIAGPEAAARGVDLSQIIAEHGDDLMYGGPHTKAAFNALAEGLALASMVPGGVTFAGYHFHGNVIRRWSEDEPPWRMCAGCSKELGHG